MSPWEETGLQETVVIYTHPDCGYSARAKNELLQLDIQFREVDLSETPEAWQEVERLTGGQRLTPVKVEGDLVTVGFNGLS